MSTTVACAHYLSKDIVHEDGGSTVPSGKQCALYGPTINVPIAI